MSRVILTPLRPGDSATLFRWINNRRLVELSAPFRPVPAAAHTRWFKAIRTRKDVAIFAIRIKRNDRLIGTCQLHSIDEVHRSAELQIRIGAPGARGRGYGVDAIRLLLHFGFHDLNLHRVWLRVFATNRRALKAYAAAGFRKEGVMRDAAFIGGRFVDVVVMGAVSRG